MELRSVDASRPRRAPTGYLARRNGEFEERTLGALTLVVAVKPGCDGCRAFVEGEHDLENEIDVLVVASLEDAAWEGRDVVVSPGLWRDLEITSAPFYVVVDSTRGVVVCEGSVFSPEQVAAEIALALGR